MARAFSVCWRSAGLFAQAGVDYDCHRAVVDKAHLHVGPEDARRHLPDPLNNYPHFRLILAFFTLQS